MSRRTRGRVNPAILVLLASIAGLASVTCLMVFRSSAPKATAQHVPQGAASLGKPERARVVGEFHQKHGDKVIDRMVAQAQKNPGYRSSLMATTKQSIWAIKRLSVEEKAEMWERTQRVQQKLRTTNQ